MHASLILQVVATVVSAAAATASAFAARASWRAVGHARDLQRQEILRQQRSQLILAETHLRRLQSMAMHEAAFGSPEYLDRRLALIAALAESGADLPHTRTLAALDRLPTQAQWSAAVDELERAMIAWARIDPLSIEARRLMRPLDDQS